jgi:hypothetical protein
VADNGPGAAAALTLLGLVAATAEVRRIKKNEGEAVKSDVPERRSDMRLSASYLPSTSDFDLFSTR